MEGWGEFAVAAAGATGALAGLVIVAISVNVKQIASSKVLLAGSASTIAALVLGVVAALLLLIPEQGHVLLGVEVLVAGLVALLIDLRSVAIDLRAVRSGTEGMTPRVLAIVIVSTVVQYAPFVVAAVLLMAGSTAGVFLVAAGIVLVVAISMFNAWVLLVEVVRDADEA